MQQVPGEVELEDADQSQYFDVEKILRWQWSSKTQRRRREFLVLWQGYPIEEAEWIPASFFSDQDALQAMFKPTGFPRNNELSSVSEDRYSSLGGRSCGKSRSWRWSCHGHWLGWCRIATNEPAFGEDQSCSLGQIALRIPVS